MFLLSKIYQLLKLGVERIWAGTPEAEQVRDSEPPCPKRPVAQTEIEKLQPEEYSLSERPDVIILPEGVHFEQYVPSPEELLMQEIEDARDILGTINGKVLDDQQMCCVIDSTPRQLVIAGAGTGKTTTIIGKIVYSLKTSSFSANEVAVFSYTAASASEIRERIGKETDSQIYAATFHSYAKRIVDTVEGNHHRKIAEKEPETFIDDKFVPGNLTEEERQLLCAIVLSGWDAVRPEEYNYESQGYPGRYYKCSINGYAVDSAGSYLISNFLTIHGIDHIYYPKTSNFLITGKNIFIQYYPVSLNQWDQAFQGEDSNALLESLWALEHQRMRYQKHDSNIIRCFSDQLAEGLLEDHLTKELSSFGLEVSLRSSSELWTLAFPPNGKEMPRIKKIVCAIISLMHSNNYSVDTVRDMVNAAGLFHGNNQRIMNLISTIYPAYRQYLMENRLSTFDDYIISAIDYLQEGKYKNPFAFLVVDEYQDIAPLRVEFLKALIQSSPSSLLCVGDDWQSIYGFNGSNVGFILDFEKYWGTASINRIEKTYRFSQSLVDDLGAFVMKNQDQIAKKIRGHNNLKGTAIRVLMAEKPSESMDIIARTLEDFPPDSTVLLIGRFRKDWDNLVKDCPYVETESGKEFASITYCQRPDLKIKFLTAHTSKGLEADNVIIINAKNETFGFPSQISTHPMVALLQGQRHSFPYEEERRLFYVAATRTKNRTYILCEKGNISPFVEELIEINPDVMYSEDDICPFCGGRLFEEEDLFDSFWACENYSNGTCHYVRNSKWYPPM